MEISIIVPVYNNEALVPRLFITLDDYLNRPDVEIIIIDDCSTDGTYAAIQRKLSVKKAARVRLVQNKVNRGPSRTRNKGLEIAHGRYIAFLDSDDAWHPRKLDIQIELMKEHRSVISGTEHAVISEDGLAGFRHSEVPVERIETRTVRWPMVVLKNPFSTPSVVIHESLRTYRFDESLHYCEDFNLWKRVIHRHNALKIKYPLTYTFKHDYLGATGSLSSRLGLMQEGLVHSYRKMLASKEYHTIDKLFLSAGLLLSYLKYARRLIVKGTGVS